MSKLGLHLFGPFRTFLGGEEIDDFESNKVRALLAYLAVEMDHPQRREVLADLLWPDYPHKSALRNLSSALADLRKNIADQKALPAFLKIERASIQLNPQSDIQVDLWDFERQLEAADHQAEQDAGVIETLTSAVSLYRGPFLEAFSLPDSSPFEEWLNITRQMVQNKMQKALKTLVKKHMGRQEYQLALKYARWQLELEPWLEEAHQDVMRLLVLTGQRSAAFAQYEVCCKALKDEFGVEPGAATVELHDQIRTGGLARNISIPAIKPDPALRVSQKRGLPLEMTRFFGRQTEIAQVKERLADWRLVTLTGSGGVGKTRLAVKVAGQIEAQFGDGVYYIELAALSDPDQVIPQVASSFGLSLDADTPILDRVSSFVQAHEILLVLDNCEHLLQTCGRVSDVLLKAGPKLKILASSREPLGITGEAIYQVPSLPFPERDEPLSPQDLDTYASIALFADRAQAVLPNYQVTAQNFAPIAQICRRLDGIPLALELAAARMKLLTADQLAGRLDERFRLLTGGSRSALPRQQTLRAAIDWSYNLLDEKERLLFHRLAIFAGGWDLEAVEGICIGDGIEAADVFDLLASLVDKSLVLADRAQGQQIRYRLLETVRQYAREKLLASVDAVTLRRRHLQYFMQLAEALDIQHCGPELPRVLDRMDQELDNFRLALEVGLAEDPRAGMRLASVIKVFFSDIGLIFEGNRWLDQYLCLPENAPRDFFRAAALIKRFDMHNWSDSMDEELVHEILEIGLDLKDLYIQAVAYFCLGWSAIHLRNDYEVASAFFHRALETVEVSQNFSGTGLIYFSLGFVSRWYFGDLKKHIHYIEIAVKQSMQWNEFLQATWILAVLGDAVGLIQGDLSQGLGFINDAIEIRQKFKLEQTLWGGYYYQGMMLCWQGEYSQANRIFAQQADVILRTDDYRLPIPVKLGTGVCLCYQGSLEAGITQMEETLNALKTTAAGRKDLILQQTHVLQLAYALVCAGRIPRARQWLDEFWPLFHDNNQLHYLPRLKKVLAFIALQEARGEDALKLYLESLHHANRISNRLLILQALEGYAWALQAVGQPLESVRCLAAAVEFRTRIGAVVFVRDKPFYDRVVSELRSSLGKAAYQSAWAEGLDAGFEAAVSGLLESPLGSETVPANSQDRSIEEVTAVGSTGTKARLQPG